MTNPSPQNKPYLQRYDGQLLKPNTAYDPLLRSIFNEQERLQISASFLAKLSGVHRTRISQLRHPKMDRGKSPTLREVRALAEALDFKFPNRLPKNGD